MHFMKFEKGSDDEISIIMQIIVQNYPKTIYDMGNLEFEPICKNKEKAIGVHLQNDHTSILRRGQMQKWTSPCGSVAQATPKTYKACPCLQRTFKNRFEFEGKFKFEFKQKRNKRKRKETKEKNQRAASIGWFRAKPAHATPLACNGLSPRGLAR